MIISYSDLTRIRKENPDKKIVFCIGVFDLTHAGHIIFFEDAKSLGDILVVAVGNDKFIKSYKGDKRPILNESVRLKSIDSLKFVDYVVLDVQDKFLGKDNHEGNLKPFFDNLEPDLYVVNDDGIDINERKKVAEKCGVKMVVLKRHCPPEFENISTSKIISRIINSYT